MVNMPVATRVGGRGPCGGVVVHHRDVLGVAVGIARTDATLDWRAYKHVHLQSDNVFEASRGQVGDIDVAPRGVSAAWYTKLAPGIVVWIVLRSPDLICAEPARAVPSQVIGVIVPSKGVARGILIAQLSTLLRSIDTRDVVGVDKIVDVVLVGKDADPVVAAGRSDVVGLPRRRDRNTASDDRGLHQATSSHKLSHNQGKQKRHKPRHEATHANQYPAQDTHLAIEIDELQSGVLRSQIDGLGDEVIALAQND